MRHSYAVSLCALLAMLPSAGHAQTSSPPLSPSPSPLDTDASYQTMLALIDEMVENKLVSRERADTLIATAKAKAGRALAANSPSAP